MKKFDDLEKHLFTRMINYFIRAEKEELAQYKSPNDNEFALQCQENLRAFKSIKSKVSKSFY